MAVSHRGFVLFGFVVNVNAKQNAHQPHGQQNPADPERISHRIAHPHLVYDARRDAQIAQYLLSCAEGGRVGDRTGENPQNHRKRYFEEFVQNGGHYAAHHHNPERKKVEP
ncbi:hypothetical protein D3C72_1514420 [compost metagenome]